MKKINWNKYSYTELQLRQAVQINISMRATLLTLGIKGEGGGYKPTKRLIEILEIDTSHWLGQGHLKGKTHAYTPPKPLKEWLVLGSIVQSYKLGKRLIKEGFLKEECNVCKITHWQGQKLSLHLDHINGINNDNRIENLRLLCPNCHSLTPTYCGKNKKKIKSNQTNSNKITKNPKKEKLTNKCMDCPSLISLKSLRCKSCAAKKQNRFKIIWPSSEELKGMVQKTSYLQVAKELGVSDNAVRKHIKHHK